MTNKLHVGNLASGTAEVQLEDLFARVGRVNEARLMQDAATGLSQGFAFITMSTSAEAAEAIRVLNGTELDGRPIRVSEAPIRNDPTGGGPRRRFMRE